MVLMCALWGMNAVCCLPDATAVPGVTGMCVHTHRERQTHTLGSKYLARLEN